MIVDPLPYDLQPPLPIRRIGIVACSSTKLNVSSEAQYLYDSTLFVFCRRYCYRFCSAWYILSAKHGVVHPRDLLSPYNQSLRFMSVQERAAWRERVRARLLALYPNGDVDFVVLAGAEYGKALEGLPRVETPLKGLGIGKRMAWLKAELEPTT